MRTLYHFPLHPASRQVRIACAEAKLKFKLEHVNPWAPEGDFLALSEEGVPPILVDVVPGGRRAIIGARAICEYVNEGSPRTPLMPSDAFERAEARRLCVWFDERFSTEVDAYLLGEKIEAVMLGTGSPDPATLREGQEHLAHHLTFLTGLLEQRDWLAGRQFSLGDVAAAGHISCLDFIGEMRWRDWPVLKDWYQRVKSRPSMRDILKDRLPGFRAPRHYTDLDF